MKVSQRPNITHEKTKFVLILTAMRFFFTAPAFSELTQADIDKIRLIVKEEVDQAVTASEVRMKEYVETSEARMTVEISKVNITVAEMDKRLNDIFTLVIALVAFIAVVIGIPQILVAIQQKEVRTQSEQIEAQQKQIEALQQEMETYR